MEWWIALLIIIGSLIILMLTGLPTAFCFLVVNFVGVFFLMGGQNGFHVLIISIRNSIANFTLLPLLLFMLMGAVLFDSGIAPLMIEALNKWLGHLPGRLGLLTVLAGTLFGTLSGSTMASVAMLGSTLVPQMERHGYQRALSMGTIMGSGGLAMLIPPSSMAVLVAVLGNFSVGRLLIGMIVPGILMAIVIGLYVIIRCWLQPSLAPAYKVENVSLSEKLSESGKYVLPMAAIVFLVTGVIFLGVATPSEAAATGCLGCFILAIIYRRLNWHVVKTSTQSSVATSVMLLIILAGASSFSQIMVFSGANKGLISFWLNLHMSPLVTVIGVEVLIAIMGCFMSPGSILMIVMPMFTPIVVAMGQDPVWFGVITLINTEMAGLTPPFGMNIFTMKAVAPKGTTLEELYHAALPFVGIDIFVIVILFGFPILTQWLPNMMR